MTPSPAPSDSRTSALGARLRLARQERGESVRGLARRIGCSASLLSQIELGRTAPSVGILYSLANELNVSTDFLLRPGSAPLAPDGNGLAPAPAPAAAPATGAATTGVATTGATTVAATVAASQGFLSLHRLPPSYQAQIQRAGSRQGIDFGNGVRWERLTTTSDTRVDFLEIVYEPGGSSDEDDHAAGHEGFEYGVVTSGELTTRVGGEEYILKAGDSIAFDSATPHVFRNAGTTTARAFWFVLHGARTG
ncbi:helix-turn-helix domain-containing protein [Streptomyces sp. NPDC055078]